MTTDNNPTTDNRYALANDYNESGWDIVQNINEAALNGTEAAADRQELLPDQQPLRKYPWTSIGEDGNARTRYML